MKKVRIAIVLEATLGGTRKHVTDLVNLLSKEDFDVTFVYSKHRADPAFEESLNSLRGLGVKFYELPMEKSLFSLYNLYSLIRMFFLFRKCKFEIIHLHAAVAGFLGRLACLGNNSIKTIYYSPHGGSFHKMKGVKGHLFRSIERFLNYKKVQIVAVSEFEKQVIINQLSIPEERVAVVYNGIRTDKKKPIVNRETVFKENGLNLPADAFILLYPAVFLPAKGHVHFFERLHFSQSVLGEQVFILLAGDGPERTQIQEAVHKSAHLSNKIVFLGFRNDIDVWTELSDLIILPSKSEAFGYVILEAFLFQKPVFASRIGGINNVIEHGRDGLLFDIDRIELMVDAINAYSYKANELKAMGLNGYQKVRQQFSIEKMVTELSNHYLRVRDERNYQ